jgi:hypothetical protein
VSLYPKTTTITTATTLIAHRDSSLEESGRNDDGGRGLNAGESLNAGIIGDVGLPGNTMDGMPQTGEVAGGDSAGPYNCSYDSGGTGGRR